MSVMGNCRATPSPTRPPECPGRSRLRAIKCTPAREREEVRRANRLVGPPSLRFWRTCAATLTSTWARDWEAPLWEPLLMTSKPSGPTSSRWQVQPHSPSTTRSSLRLLGSDKAFWTLRTTRTRTNSASRRWDNSNWHHFLQALHNTVRQQTKKDQWRQTCWE